MRQRKFILDEHGEPVPCESLMKWAHWFEKSHEQRVVAETTIGDSQISTVFLALNHRYGPGDPILWETMVFGGKLQGEQDRCSGSREQAEAMHKRMVERVKSFC